MNLSRLRVGENGVKSSQLLWVHMAELCLLDETLPPPPPSPQPGPRLFLIPYGAIWLTFIVIHQWAAIIHRLGIKRLWGLWGIWLGIRNLNHVTVQQRIVPVFTHITGPSIIPRFHQSHLRGRIGVLLFLFLFFLILNHLSSETGQIHTCQGEVWVNTFRERCRNDY